MHKNKFFFSSVQHVLTMLVIALPCTSARAEEEKVSFETRVAPVLSAKCVSCHHPGNAKGGLDLSTRVGLIRGGELGAGVVPGKPDDSPIYTRAIVTAGQKPEMPAKGEPLTPIEAAALRVWIEQGVNWPDKLVLREKSKADASFWSFQPRKELSPPAANEAPTTWQAHPIDRFVWQQLHERGLQPNPPADARTFIRRATFDLLGLPPTPEEVATFVQECSEEHAGKSDRVAPQAVARLIDRLLQNPHYGEHWGRHWLDVIRFGESRGYERNEIITNLWPFRDYVIRSFNEDKPFDQLVLEHLAGDVVGKDQPEIEIGSAFLVAGPYDDVGNQDPAAAAQIRADQMDEIIRATSEAFLGLTMGCARCHDHKFDPLTQKDYYALYATFAGTVHGPREVSTVEARNQREAQLSPLRTQRGKLVAEQAALEKELVDRIQQREAEGTKQWTRPRASRYGTEETFEPHPAKFIRLTVEGNDSADPKRTGFGIDEFEVWTDEENPRNVALATLGGTATGASRAPKDFAGAYDVALTIDGKFGERWSAAGNTLQITLKEPQKIRRVLFSSDRPRALGEDHFLTNFVGEYRIETSLNGKDWKQVAGSQDRQPATPALKQARLRQLLITDADRAKQTALAQEIARLDAAIGKVPALPMWWVGTHRAITQPQHVFLGGSPQRPGEPVVPASLEVLASLPSAYALKTPENEGARRVALAKWLTAAENPLTSRVLANRLWQYHFGRGIVETPSDFGYMGNRPTHPELLDWLATELLRGGWKLKSMHKLIMTSQAYQQSGAWREDAARQDADSRYLWRYPPRRLAAEEIRDTLLSITGKLDVKMGGPGFRLYEYQQDNVATYVPLDTHGPDTYRRAVYHHNARAARVDVLTDFDCPDPAFAEPRRAATTTPLQALTLMNHRFSLDMVRALTERLEREEKSPDRQIQRAFELVVARAPSEKEFERAKQLVSAHGLRALCRALLNSNELIYVN
jgi:cytochrome c553